MKDNIENIIKKHIASDKIIESVSMTTDFKTHNKEMKKLNELVLSISHDREMCKIVYGRLLKSENAVTLLNAASECLKLNIYLKEAKKILKELAKRKDIGIISFNAKMMLEVMKENSN